MPTSTAAADRPALFPATVPAVLALADGTVFRGRAIGAWGAAVFLASSAADYVTGHVLYVDGGFSAAY